MLTVPSTTQGHLRTTNTFQNLSRKGEPFLQSKVMHKHSQIGDKNRKIWKTKFQKNRLRSILWCMQVGKASFFLGTWWNNVWILIKHLFHTWGGGGGGYTCRETSGSQESHPIAKQTKQKQNKNKIIIESRSCKEEEKKGEKKKKKKKKKNALLTLFMIDTRQLFRCQRSGTYSIVAYTYFTIRHNHSRTQTIILSGWKLLTLLHSNIAKHQHTQNICGSFSSSHSSLSAQHIIILVSWETSPVLNRHKHMIVLAFHILSFL